MDSFRKNIPIEWVSEAVNQTGRAAVRKRRFPAEQAVWLVLGIGLMRIAMFAINWNWLSLIQKAICPP
ncbi:transposase domain-containing protein [Shewanella saliphila]|uniref:transposase domain-containing protein n=1 Tax=Shewanella saliphila TaxID=2282698 RepID=UPI003570AE3B